MNALSTKNKQGFTIIEVVLVLAIAALIFLMVFIALPALQRNQRDTQRKNDLGRFMSAVTSYQSNNRGKVPAATAAAVSGVVSKYLTVGGDTFTDPAGDNYAFEYYDSGAAGDTLAAPTAENTIKYGTKATCGEDGALAVGSGPRKVAASIKLESGAYCQNN